MDDKQQRQKDRFVRVKNFGTANAADGTGTDAAQHVAKLAAIIADMEKARAGQKGISAETQQALLEGLLADARDIARTARAIGQEEIGFDMLFPRPKAENPAAVLLSVDTILTNLAANPDDDTATQAAKAARLVKLTAHGLSSTLPADLAANRAQYISARDAEDTGDNAGVEDTAAIIRLVAEGMKECQFLDAIYHNIYRRNPDKLAAWISANNVEDAPKKKKAAPAPAPAP